MSKIEVDAITQQSGTTLTVGGGACKTATVDATTVTLGRSGGTVSLAAGATQSGFGRTGTVDWQTAIKTGDFTAVSGEGYFVNTTSGAITVTLPASPSVGAIVSVADYAGTAGTNNITIGRNGSNIEGGTSNPIMLTNREAKTFIYADATQGWVPVNSNDATSIPSEFATASGGTVTESGDYKIHTFTGPGTFTVCSAGSVAANNVVSYMVVAGGAAGGGNHGGGGGAGGFREYRSPVSGCYSVSPLNGNPGGTAVTISSQAYPITVGGGGAQVLGCTTGTSGSNSVFSTITSAGGGGGAGQGSPAANGGSGGGGTYTGACGSAPHAGGGTGNTPSTTPAQGTNGGTGHPQSSPYGGAGGGGATAAGNPYSSSSGAGGAGATTSINASPVTRAGGGGSAATSYGASSGAGGAGGGGAGSTGPGNFTNGTANTGGGGGGGYNSGPKESGAGGSGIIIIRYKFQ